MKSLSDLVSMGNILLTDVYCLEILRKKKLNKHWKGCCLLVEKEC